MRKIFTFLFAALMSVGMFAATVTWNSNTLSSIYLHGGDSFTQDGVTLTVLDGMIDGRNFMGFSNEASFKFSTSLGNFTMIEITGNINALGGSGWTQTSLGAVWTGEANETTFGMAFNNVSQIVFTIAEPAPTAKYYVVGDMTNWAVSADYEMTPSNVRVDEVEEYKYEITLTTSNQFKIVKVEGENQTWFPDGMGNAYGENGEIERDGDYTIYFRPNGDGDEDWFYGYIFAARHLVYEDVVVGVLLPENGKPENGVNLVGTFSDEPMATEVIEETGGYIAIFEADGGDTFTFVDADDEDNYLVMRNADGEWVPAVFTFGEVWEDDTYKGDPVKMIDMDLSDNSKYAWANAIPDGIEEIVLSEKAESRKVMINGTLYIVRDGKLFNVTGAQVR